MATTIFVKRKLGSIVPVDVYAAEKLADFPPDEILKAVITRPRNHKHSRKFHALLAVIFPHQDTYPTRETFRKAIQAALGYADKINLPNGGFMLEAHSIAFDKMDQTEFEAFYDRVINLIQTRILPGINRDDVNREVEEIMRGQDKATHTEKESV